MQRRSRILLWGAVSWAIATVPVTASAGRIGSGGFPDVVGFLVHIAQPDESRAQTFTIERSGILGEIAINLYDEPNAPSGVGPLADPLVLEVRPTENGIPQGADSVLGSVELRPSDLGLPRTEPLTFRFAPLAIEVDEGEVLAFVLGPGSGGAMQQLVSRSGQEVYAGGTSFTARDFSDDFEDRGIDYGFEVLVVPEPAPALLVSLGLAFLARAPRRRRG